MQLDIEKGAFLAIEENDHKSIWLRRYVPMPVSRARGEATAAILRSPVLGTPPTKTAASDSTARQRDRLT